MTRKGGVPIKPSTTPRAANSRTGRDHFSSCHPAVNFLYFVLVLLFAMFCLHPVSLTVSLACALAYALSLKGWRGVRAALGWMVPMALLALVINSAFNHQGATILTYLPGGNPLTLESLLYGAAAAVMLCAVVTWFICFNAVLTSDKFIYLFGRVIPALSLALSMTLRFVPRFAAQFSAVRTARRGMAGEPRGLRRHAREGAALLGALVTWSLENAIETADSMKSRGYGLPGRTAFALYRMDGRDRAVLAWLAFCGVYLLAGALAGGLDWQYYPTLDLTLAGALPVSFQAVHLGLCLTPIILNGKEARRWTPSTSKT